jgi:hypothetical protein
MKGCLFTVYTVFKKMIDVTKVNLKRCYKNMTFCKKVECVPFQVFITGYAI